MIKVPTITDEDVQKLLKERENYLKEKEEYDKIIERMMSVLGVTNEIELANFFEIRSSDFYRNQKDLIIPVDWIKKFIWEKKISPNWLLSGEGEKEL